MSWPVVKVERLYRFRAQHSLIHAGNPNAREMHWHDYKAIIIFHHEINPNFGWAMDFDELDKKVEPLFEWLNLKTLNNILPMSMPTCEALACTILKSLQGFVTGVRVGESDKVSAEVNRKTLRDWEWSFDWKTPDHG